MAERLVVNHHAAAYSVVHDLIEREGVVVAIAVLLAQPALRRPGRACPANRRLPSALGDDNAVASLVQMAMKKQSYPAVAELVEDVSRVVDSQHDSRLNRYLRITGQLNRGGYQM